MRESDIQNILDAIAAGYNATTNEAALRAAINAGYESLVGYRIFDDSPDMPTIEGQELFLGVLGEHMRAAAGNAETVIRECENVLSEGQENCAGNADTEGENADPETIFFDALKACRAYLA